MASASLERTTGSGFVWCVLGALLMCGTGEARPTRPHLFVFLQDDLGYDDVAYNGNDANLDVTGNITAAAREGVVLKRHYVHWHCSPTRRSLLTGRLPLHHSEFLSDVSKGDDIDLRWTTIAQKLKTAGYATHWYGKGHTGYKSWNHLPEQLGFDDFLGFLGGSQDHFAESRWAGQQPLHDVNRTYSADLYGRKAIETLKAYDPHAPNAKPLFFYLPWQNVHSPFQAREDWKGDVLRGMLSASDEWTGRIIQTLKDKGMWQDTAVFYSSDNGGDGLASNWPLRGSKHTNWEGGMRASAFLSGGLVPPASRGTESKVVSHIADWYTTLCMLAHRGDGDEAAAASCQDDPPQAPAAVDPNDACIEDPMHTPCKDIYGKDSYPGVDGVDVWAAHTGADTRNNVSASHAKLWLSAEVLMVGDYKLIVAQQQPAKSANPPIYGWKCNNPHLNSTKRCDSLHSATEPYFDATAAECKCGCQFKDRAQYTPCLFDVGADPSEFAPLEGEAAAKKMAVMWRQLNLTNLELYARAPGPRREGSSPAHLVGACNQTCTEAYWSTFGVHHAEGPQCGVPACS